MSFGFLGRRGSGWILGFGEALDSISVSSKLFSSPSRPGSSRAGFWAAPPQKGVCHGIYNQHPSLSLFSSISPNNSSCMVAAAHIHSKIRSLIGLNHVSCSALLHLHFSIYFCGWHVGQTGTQGEGAAVALAACCRASLSVCRGTFCTPAQNTWLFIKTKAKLCFGRSSIQLTI